MAFNPNQDALDPTDPDQQRRQALLAGLSDDPNAQAPPAPKITTGGNTTQPGPDGIPPPASTPPAATTAPNPYANGGTTPITVPPGLKIKPGPVAGQGLPMGTPPAAATAPLDYSTDQGILSQLAAWSKLPGANPSLTADPQYWLRRIKETGGLRADNLDYWKGRGLTPEGPPEGASPSAAPTVDPAQAAFAQQLRDALMGQIQGLQTPETAESGDIQPAISAFNNQSTRDQQRMRDQLAEIAYAKSAGGNPLDSGGFNLAAQQAAEAGANDRANFTGTTVANANNARRQALLSMLGSGLQEQGLGQQDTQFHDSLAEMYAALLAGINQNTVTSGLTGA